MKSRTVAGAAELRMSFDLINPWMLAGLAGVGLPVVAHLLSRKKYDVVNWGAMQFLELGRNARRRLRLEELLLMLLRMALIALLTVALARPWMSGGLASGLTTRPACDVAIVIDSSYSTDWRGKAKSPHQSAVIWARNFVRELGVGDTVGVLDARDQVVSPLGSLTRDHELVKRTLDELPQPSGSSRLHEAVIKGLQLVNTGSNVSRNVVVVMDGQAFPWRSADDHFRLQLKELRQQATVPADIWVVSTQTQQATPVNNAVDRIELSRELTVAGFPVRIRTRILNTGARAASNERVYLEVDGQRLAKKTLSVRIEPDGQASVEFEHRFNEAGSHVVSVVIDEDGLPGDDRADAAIVISDALPVLLIDGAPHSDPTKSELFFAANALSAAANPTPWVAARTVTLSAFHSDSIQDAQVVVVGNAPKLTDEQHDVLTRFVDGGGGLVIAAGDRIDEQWYNAKLFDRGRGLLPAFLVSMETASTEPDAAPVMIESESLKLPWISRFQAGTDDGFLDARFTNWYRLSANPDLPPNPDADEEGLDESRAPSVTAGRMTNGDPFVVSRRFGRGNVAMLASTLDADWTTLPAKPDYVAFLHELVFQLASGRMTANVDAGTPLIHPLNSGEVAGDFVFVDPAGEELEPLPAGDELRPAVRLDETWLPGIYRLRGKGAAEEDEAVFVVNFDRSESDLAAMSEDRWAELTQDDQIRRISTPDELFESLKTETARVELWHILLLVFLAILVGELYMTRRLVQGGHFYSDPDGDGAIAA